MREKQSIQAIRRGVRIANRKPGSRINSGFTAFDVGRDTFLIPIWVNNEICYENFYISRI